MKPQEFTSEQLGIWPPSEALRTEISFLALFRRYTKSGPLPIPWIPVLYNAKRHPAETMMYIMEHYDMSNPPWSAEDVGILSLLLDCHYSLGFPRALPIELKGIAV